MGPHCAVKKPAELAERVKDLAAGIVKQYQQSSTVLKLRIKKTGRTRSKARHIPAAERTASAQQ